MIKGITFESRQDAKEFASWLQRRGDIAYIQQSADKQKWIVFVSEEEGKVTPTSLRELAELEEKEAAAERTLAEQAQTRKVRAGVKIEEGKATIGRTYKSIAKGIPKGAAKELGSASEEMLSGKALEKPLETSSRKIHVKGGMKSTIPMVGGARHGYFARIGEIGTPHIADTEVGKQMPRIALSDIGKTPKIARGSGVPQKTRFQRPARERPPTLRRDLLPTRFPHPYLKSPKEKEEEL